MLEIKVDNVTKQISLEGRFKAIDESKATKVFEGINTTYSVDFSSLYYISSAGLSVLVMTQNRLEESGHQLILRNMNQHIRELFSYTGFDMIFKIE
jgi:anti-anti-sigma factor